MRVTRLLFAVFTAVSAIDMDHRCGSVDRSIDTKKVSLSYDTHESLRRRMGVVEVPQSYRYNSTFVPLRTLQALGFAAPIRIATVWDAVLNGDQSYECSAVGQSIYTHDSSGITTPTAGYSMTASFCKEQHVVRGSAGSARYQAIVSRTQQAVNFFTSSLKVRPVVSGGVPIDSTIVSQFNLSTSVVPNADLVLIMTARPSPNAPIAGFATCLQSDQYNRCTVGWFNWVPELINVAQAQEPNVRVSELHTALHEVVHVLGGVGPGFTAATSPFLNDTTGLPMDPSFVFKVSTDVAYGRVATYITTPKVRAIARSAFGCDTLIGFPLEDLPLGAGVHWEARLAGPELMSYGTGSGRVYFSDLTFAFLEDTNQYIANYSFAGKLIPDTPADAILEDPSHLIDPRAPPIVSNYTPPGIFTWGRGKGCNFFTKSARQWPSEYICSKPQEAGCTPDHYMSAICVIQTTWSNENSCASQGSYVQGSGAQCTIVNPALSGGGRGIPPIQQFYTSSSAISSITGISGAQPSTTGGFSNAMDYVPVNVGYWSCQDTAAPAVDITSGENVFSLKSVSDVFTSVSQANVAGQSRCPTCRCLKSSMQKLSVTPLTNEYGLCYATNCYRADYLQVGVKGVLGGSSVYWYRCRDGGSIAVPGFSGRISCPASITEWCSVESITGLQYPEVNLTFEYIIWSLIGVFFVALVFVCGLGTWRVGAIWVIKNLCGVRRFDPQADPKADAELAAIKSETCCRSRPRTWIGWFMFWVNLMSLCLGLCMAAVGIVALAIPAAVSVAMNIFRVTLLFLSVALIGMFASCRRASSGGPSCWLLTYVFLEAAQVLFILWIVGYIIALDGWQDLGSQAITSLYEAWTFGYQRDFLDQNQAPVALLCALCIFVYIGVLIAALFHVRSWRTLASVLLTGTSYVFIIFGVISMGVGSYLLIVNTADIANKVGSIGVGGGLLFLAMASLGLTAVWTKGYVWLVLYAVIGFLTAALLLVVVGACGGQPAVDYIHAQPAEAIFQLSMALGATLTRAALITPPYRTLRQLAVCAGLLFALIFLLLVSAGVFAWAVREEREEDEDMKRNGVRINRRSLDPVFYVPHAAFDDDLHSARRPAAVNPANVYGASDPPYAVSI